MLRSVSFLVVLVALLPYSAQAIPVRISADVLRVGTYDSGIDGFGTIVDDFDLGTVHAGLSGVLLDVTTVNDSGNAEVKVDAGARWNINRDKGSIVYSFSSAVAFHFSTGGGGDGPFTGNNVIFGDGELLTFTGDPGSFPFLVLVRLTPICSLVVTMCGTRRRHRAWMDRSVRAYPTARQHA